MAQISLKGMMLPISLYMTDENGNRPRTQESVATDYVAIETSVGLDKNGYYNVKKGTDFIVAGGVIKDDSRLYPEQDRTGGGVVERYTLDSAGNGKIKTISNTGEIASANPTSEDYGVAPWIRLDLHKFMEARNRFADFGNIINRTDGYENVVGGKIMLGAWPQSRADLGDTQRLNDAFEAGDLKATGRVYDGCTEYDMNGRRFVRREVKNSAPNQYYYSPNPDDYYNEVRCGDFDWFEVEPIEFSIKNWNQMPKEINPAGDGSAKHIDLVSYRCISGAKAFDENSGVSWKDSSMRKDLNTMFMNLAFEPMYVSESERGHNMDEGM